MNKNTSKNFLTSTSFYESNLIFKLTIRPLVECSLHYRKSELIVEANQLSVFYIKETFFIHHLKVLALQDIFRLIQHF